MPRRSPQNQDLNELVDIGVSAFQGLSPARQRVVALVVLVVGVIAFAIYFSHLRPYPPAPTPAPAGAAEQMLLGNPSGATGDPANRDNYLMMKPYYCLSYNDTNGTPNWVSWRVTASDLGDSPRKPVFDPDPELPADFYHVTHKDYSGSGFDRGHMCPHSDRGANQDMSFATFIMTNIIPQAPNVNQKAWAQLETYCRNLVRERQKRLYIVSGPFGRGGIGRNGFRESLAGGRVTAPAECWKIIVVVDDDGANKDLFQIGRGTRVIAVDMPNNEDVVGEEWDLYRTSPAAIERKTGFRFFDRLRPEVAQALREKVDDAPIPPPRPLHHP